MKYAHHKPMFATLAAAVCGCLLSVFPAQAPAQISKVISMPPSREDTPAPTPSDYDPRNGVVSRAWVMNRTDIPYEPYSTAFDIEGNLLMQTSTYLMKFSGTNGSAPPITWQTAASGYFLSEIHTDYSTNIYRTEGSNDIAGLVRYNPSGVQTWSTLAASGRINIDDFVVDDDGVPIALGYSLVAGPEFVQPAVYRFDPVTGATAWRTPITNGSAGGHIWAVALSRRGGVFVAHPANSGWLLERLDADTGTVLSSTALAISDQIVPGARARLQVLSDDSVLVMTSHALICVSPSGEIKWSRPQQNFGRYSDVEADRFGNIFEAEGDSSTLPHARVVKLNANTGATIWDRTYPQIMFDFDTGAGRIALDRVGNVYYTVGLNTFIDNGANRFGQLWTAKLDASTGDVVWQQYETPPSPGNKIQGSEIIVDNGGSVYSVCNNTNYQNNPQQWLFVVKYTQAFLYVPTTHAASPNFQISRQSIWGPGAAAVEASAPLFTLPLDLAFGGGGTEDLGPFGVWGGGFDFSNSGSLFVGVKAEASGGSTDIKLPVNVEFQTPNSDKVYPGGNFTVTTDWSPSGAAEMTTVGRPTFNAGFTYSLEGHVQSSMYLIAADDELFNDTLFDKTYDYPPGPGVDYIPGLNVLDLMGTFGDFVQGKWFSVGNDVLSLDFRLPPLLAQGTYAENTGTFTSNANDLFVKGRLNVTEAILAAFDATARFGEEVEGNGYSFGFHANLLQFLIGADMSAEQTITAKTTPRVCFDLNGDGVCDTPDYALGEDVEFHMPAGVTRMNITPRVYMRADFTNTTKVHVIPKLEWQVLDLGINAEVLGCDVLDLSTCQVCDDYDIADLPLTIYSNSWTVNTTPISLPAMGVTASSNVEPRITGCSRTSLSARLYNQLGAPTTTKFNLAANGSSNMLIYGDRLVSGAVAYISHYGRIEALPTTHVNDSNLLVSVPNRFRLIPGVARLYVITSLGTSNTIDLAIELPVPRLSTVNPNLWAADPAMSDLPIQVIDGQSLVGTDTFIARRDYYYNMIKPTGAIWNSAAVGGLSASQYFPNFDFSASPPFPAVFVDGKPLPRFEQPVDSGIHNVRFPEASYDRPKVVSVYLHNPGPGGGQSNTLSLDIAAPVPVISSTEPSEILPTMQPFELVVHGPDNVPFWDGYEEPKYGNFNASSVVRLDGAPLTTRFINSATLIASVPVMVSLSSVSNHIVTVFTPANGSYYFERLVTGDGVPLTASFVPSGGESPAYLFPVRYPEPVINVLSPATTNVDNIVFAGGIRASQYNVSLIGSHFRPGSEVYINGSSRPSEFVSETIMKVQVQMEDVRVPGDLSVIIRNPGPDFQSSQPATLSVVP